MRRQAQTSQLRARSHTGSPRRTGGHALNPKARSPLRTWRSFAGVSERTRYQPSAAENAARPGFPHWMWAPGSLNPSIPLHCSLLSTWSSGPPSHVETPSRSAPNLPSPPKAWSSSHSRVDLGSLPNCGGLALRGLLHPHALFLGTPATCGFHLLRTGRRQSCWPQAEPRAACSILEAEVPV